ncbi:MAG: biotin/lipoyl-binding protein [Meiothermus sp.]|nr:biotin/lipoyl-binding protein [Meiothermus sp.]
MRRWIWIPIVLLVAGLTAFGLLRPRAQQGISVNVARASQGEFVREVRATGTVEARLYNLTFSRPGRVAEVRVREGQNVQAGQVLAVLDTASEQAQLQTARENLVALQSRVTSSAAEVSSNRSRLQTQLGEARRNLELSRRLLAVGSAAPNEVQSLQRQVADLQAQLNSLDQGSQSTRQDLQAQIQARQAEIANLQRTISQSSLRATVAGSVSSVGYLVGVDTTTASGTQAPSIRLVEAGSLRIQTRLTEADIAGVRPGQPVRIELDSAPGQPLTGKVDRLGVQAETTGGGGSAVLPVFIRFLGPQAETLARPGLTATTRITTLRLQSAVRIPLETLLEENRQTSVWLIDPAARTVKKTPITVRARNLTQAAVEGLSPDALLVSLAPEALRDGSKVSYVLEEGK